MGTSIIISSNSIEFINEKLNIIRASNKSSTHDILQIDVEQDKLSIGIGNLSEFKKWVNIRPFSGGSKTAIIHRSHLMTTEAQNSILKILEEPNSSTSIILICDNFQKLLPTIISRCQIIEDNNRTEHDQININDFLKMDLIEKFDYLEKINKMENKKDLIENILKMLLNYFRDELLNSKNKMYIDKINLITEAKKMIDLNVPSKNVLDNLLIQLDL